MTPDPETPAADPEPSPEQVAHDALMNRIIEASYIQTLALAKVAQIRASFVPRTLICAAVHGVEKQIDSYARREAQADVIPFNRRERSEMKARIIDDLSEIEAAMNDASESIAAVRASFTIAPSDLIS